MCVLTRVCAHTGTHIEARGLSLAWNPTSMRDWLTRDPQGPACLHPFIAGKSRVLTSSFFKPWILGDRT